MPATPRSARQERVARVTTTPRSQVTTNRSHQRVADSTGTPARQHPSQPDEFLRRARALDSQRATDTDANVRVLRRLLGEGTVR